MRTVNATVHGKEYKLACDEGQEQHLYNLVKQVNGRADRLAQAVGPLREQDTMMLYIALTLADELYDAHREISRLRGELEDAQNVLAAGDADAKLAAAEDAFAQHLEALTAKVANLSGKLDAA